jgi:hypothetical protein
MTRVEYPKFEWFYFALILVVGCQTPMPSGNRVAFMRSVHVALMNYAADNGGAFPAGDDSYAAFAKLYPDYSDVGAELAGLSGSIHAVTNSLVRGVSISNLTSWVYIPGLQEGDDMRIAILWESMPGLTQAGRTSSQRTRPVLLLDGSITNVPLANWEVFLECQARFRAQVEGKRKTGSN